jgi:predicted Na+-dependent transporter
MPRSLLRGSLLLVAYLVSLNLFPKGKNVAITYSSGMKNLPIAIGIAAMSFKGLEMLPVAWASPSRC